MTEKELVKSCVDGNKQSLETLIKSIQPFIFNLTLRFVWNRMDAEDATQEILIKIVTNLSKYKGKSKFQTWAYRVAINYLLNLKPTKLEKALTSFDVFAQNLTSTNAAINYVQPDQDLLEKEMKVGCTLAMLQCLDRDLRIAFILGSILKVKSSIAAQITQTSAENFRKRVEQSRKLIASFLNSYCGVYNPHNVCRCQKRINTAIACGRINPMNLSFANKIESYNDEMEELSSLTGIYQNHGNFASTSNFVSALNELIATKKIMNEN